MAKYGCNQTIYQSNVECVCGAKTPIHYALIDTTTNECRDYCDVCWDSSIEFVHDFHMQFPLTSATGSVSTHIAHTFVLAPMYRVQWTDEFLAPHIPTLTKL